MTSVIPQRPELAYQRSIARRVGLGSLLTCLTTLIQAQPATSQPDRIASTIPFQGKTVSLSALPKSLKVKEPLGIVTTDWVQGKVIHHARDREGGLYETRAVITPGGDYLLMFPDGGHYGPSEKKTNDMLAYRSSDHGRTWQGPTVAFNIDYNQHGFIPLIPKGTKRIYAFGTQPDPTLYSRQNGLQENAPIGYRYSDDDGRTWSAMERIRPKNDPDYLGMSVMRMTETDKGTWLLGTHEGDWSYKPLMTRLYLMRSTDQGKTWTLLPGKRHGGWYARCFNRMDEGRPIALGNGKVLFMMRTPEGHLWSTRSEDDGETWSEPQPTPLIHPDAPPMLFHLSDGKTLIAFHHNRFSDLNYTGLSGTKKEVMQDRSEIWFSLSTDEGRTWSEPRFVFANALDESFSRPFRNYQCSYMDMFMDGDQINLFIPHRWERVLHLQFSENSLSKFPTRKDILP